MSTNLLEIVLNALAQASAQNKSRHVISVGKAAFKTLKRIKLMFHY
jgi:hypothetical protein